MIPFEDTGDPERARYDLLRKSLDVPSSVKCMLDRASTLRGRMEELLYPVNRDRYTVVTHHVLRVQQALLAHLTATDPAANFKPPQRWDTEDGAPDPELTWLSRTLERLTNYYMKRARLIDSLNAQTRDAFTVRAGWIKLIWKGDPYRMPNGAKIMDPKKRQQIYWRAMKAMADAGELNQESAEWAAYKDAEATVRRQVIDELHKILSQQYGPDLPAMVIEEANPANDPTLARYYDLLFREVPPALDEVDNIPQLYEFEFDVIDIEDMRIDFQLARPEFYRRSPRFSFRVRMTKEEIIGTFDVPADKWRNLGDLATAEGESTYDAQDVSEGKTSDGSETRADSSHIDVWETWDAETGHVYTYCNMVDGWLDKSPWGVYDSPPFFLFTMNEVSGSVYGPSHVELLWDLQQEMNDLRRHQRQHRRAAMPKLLAQEGSMEDDDVENYENSEPFSVVFVRNVEDIRRSTHQLNGAPYTPGMYDRNDTFLDFQLSSGMPTSGLGGTATSNLATEVAFAREELNTQLQRMTFSFNRMLTDIVLMMSRILVRALPVENVGAIAGQVAAQNWPTDPDLRESLLLDLVVDVKANATGRPDLARELDHLTKINNIMAQQGMQMSAAWFLQKLNEIEDTGLDWTKAILAQGPMPSAGGAPGPTEDVPPGPTRPGSPSPTGESPGPAPGTPGGGFTRTPQVSELPGDRTPG